MRTERCDKCRFWEEDDVEKLGEIPLGFCHRYPPEMTDRNIYTNVNAYADDWCGEFFPADNNSLIDDVKKTGRVPGARY
jgi:hypothetical protein